MTTRAPSIQDQADFLYGLRLRCTMRDGSIAGETTMLLTREEVEALDLLRARLERMAPFEDRIRAIVTRGRE